MGQRIELNTVRSDKWIVREYGKEISRKVDGGSGGLKMAYSRETKLAI
jgi:hypothetical protein